MEIPVRAVTFDELKATLTDRIRRYEAAYGMSSAEMSRCVSAGQVAETEKLLRWMQADHVLGSRFEPTLTTGILGITT